MRTTLILIRKLQKLLDNHYKAEIITCREDCICWDLQAVINKYEYDNSAQKKE